MATPSEYQVVGVIWLFVFLPIHTLTLIWYILRRRFFPIFGRHWKLTCGLLIQLTPVLIFLGYERHLHTNTTLIYLFIFTFDIVVYD
jgi:hypothetical protein